MTEKVSIEDGELLLKLARHTILYELGEKKVSLVPLKKKVSSLILEENRGIFVSLHKQGDLRGCIGNIEPVKTIFDGVRDNAKHAALNDPRFSPLSVEELKDTCIEVSILTRPSPLDYSDADDLIKKLRPAVDGVIIQQEDRRATFLPQVWNQLKTPELFLSHLCMKAGLSSGEWKSGSLKVSTYQVQLFEEGC